MSESFAIGEVAIIQHDHRFEGRECTVKSGLGPVYGYNPLTGVTAWIDAYEVEIQGEGSVLYGAEPYNLRKKPPQREEVCDWTNVPYFERIKAPQHETA